MASKNKLAAAKYGYGTIGVDVFFSIADIYRLKEMVANLQTTCVAGEVATRDLMRLHDKLIAAIISSEDSVFAPEQGECYEIDNKDIKL